MGMTSPAVEDRIALTGPIRGRFKAGDQGKIVATLEDGSCEIQMAGMEGTVSVRPTGFRVLALDATGTLDEVRRIIAEHSGTSIDAVKPKSNIMDDLGNDSLDVIELIMRVEEAFAVRIPTEDISRLETPEDVAAMIDRIQGRA